MAFWTSCLHNISKFSSFAKVSYLWSRIIHSDGDKKWQVGNSMTDIIKLFHLIQYFVLKGSFERIASAHGDENPQSSMKSFQVPVSMLHRHTWMQWFDPDISWKSKTHWRSRSVYFHSTKSHSWATSEKRGSVSLDLLL